MLKKALFSKYSLHFQIVLNAVRMHALETLFSNILCSSKSFQILSDCMFQRHYFQKDLCDSESFQIRQNACFRHVVFNIFSAVPNRFKYYQNACFRHIVFKMFTEVIRVVSNSVRLHALPCFQNCLCSSKISFQIASECTI